MVALVVVMLSVDGGWTVNYGFFTAQGSDRKAGGRRLSESWGWIIWVRCCWCWWLFKHVFEGFEDKVKEGSTQL